MNNLENNSAVIVFPSTETEDMPPSNYEPVRYNALKHGILSRLVVLSHESGEEFADLMAALIEEHQPAGMTERHLIEELASIIWRKRRVLMAEGAKINEGLKGSVRNAESVISAAAPFERGLSGKDTDLRDFVDMTPADVVKHQRDTRNDLNATRKVSAILRRGGENAYEKAVRALVPDSLDWWQQYVEDEEYSATAEGLTEFIQNHLEPLCMTMEKEARHHEAIKAQMLGEGLQAFKLEKLNRYETHLDRKFERTLAMLLKLKELNSGR